MGKLIDGEWHPARKRSRDDEDSFDGWVRADPDAQFPAEPDRYHLYISRACPWAHRTALVRQLKGLTDVGSVDVVDPIRREDGWEFTPNKDGCTADTVNGHKLLRDVYTEADSTYTGQVTVPVLFDTKTGTIVNNESAEIARMLNDAFDEYASVDVDLYPDSLRDEIDDVIDRIHERVNTGVYKAGFADTQEQYQAAVDDLFDALDYWDEFLQDRRFLVGETLTLADVFLFPTLYRFDSVYHTHFKCTVRRLVDYQGLWPYARDIAQLPGVDATLDRDHVKRHYYRSHDDINPTQFVPVGPVTDWSDPHDRGKLPGSLPGHLE